MLAAPNLEVTQCDLVDGGCQKRRRHPSQQTCCKISLCHGPICVLPDIFLPWWHHVFQLQLVHGLHDNSLRYHDLEWCAIARNGGEWQWFSMHSMYKPHISFRTSMLKPLTSPPEMMWHDSPWDEWQNTYCIKGLKQIQFMIRVDPPTYLITMKIRSIYLSLPNFNVYLS